MNLMHILKTIAELAVILGFFAIVFMALPGNPAKENRNDRANPTHTNAPDIRKENR